MHACRYSLKLYTEGMEVKEHSAVWLYPQYMVFHPVGQRSSSAQTLSLFSVVSMISYTTYIHTGVRTIRKFTLLLFIQALHLRIPQFH